VPGEKNPIRWRSMSFADELKTRLEELASKNREQKPQSPVRE
jgi:predicted transcriptional regulator